MLAWRQAVHSHPSSPRASIRKIPPSDRKIPETKNKAGNLDLRIQEQRELLPGRATKGSLWPPGQLLNLNFMQKFSSDDYNHKNRCKL
jgi:hypothetical protein